MISRDTVDRFMYREENQVSGHRTVPGHGRQWGQGGWGGGGNYYNVRYIYMTEKFARQQDGPTDGWMDGEMEGEMDGERETKREKKISNKNKIK